MGSVDTILIYTITSDNRNTSQPDNNLKSELFHEAFVAQHSQCLSDLVKECSNVVQPQFFHFCDTVFVIFNF